MSRRNPESRRWQPPVTKLAAGAQPAAVTADDTATVPGSESDILSSRISPPSVTPGQLLRPGLEKLFDAAGPVSTLFLTAPAGFGKTRLLAQLVDAARGRGGSVVWAECGPHGEDFKSIIDLLFAAYGRESGDERPLAFSGRDNRRPIVDLLNRIGDLPRPVIVALDSIDRVSDPDVWGLARFIMDGLPPGVLLAVTSRSALPWPAGRARMDGRLVEMGPDELRFSTDELRRLVTDMLGLDVGEGDIEALNRSSGGWPIIADMAVRSIIRRPDHILSFEAILDQHGAAIHDYLNEEVLDALSATERAVVRATVPFGTFPSALIPALLDMADPGPAIEDLVARNILLHVNGLGSQFTHHQPLARALAQRMPDEERRGLLSLAADWFIDNDMPVAAISSLIAAGRLDQAADKAAQLVNMLLYSSQAGLMIDWTDALPAGLIDRNPSLWRGRLWAMYLNGKFAALTAELEEVSRRLDDKAIEGGACADLELDMLLLGDLVATANREPMVQIGVLERMGVRFGDDHPMHVGILQIALGRRYLAIGNLAHAEHRFLSAYDRNRICDNGYAAVQALCNAAIVRRYLGRFDEAAELCVEAIRQCNAPRYAATALAAVPCLQLAEIAFEHNDLHGTEQWLGRTLDLEARLGDPMTTRHAAILSAKLRAAWLGTATSDRWLAAEAARIEGRGYARSRRVTAARITLSVAAGKLDLADALIRSLDLPVDLPGPAPSHNIPFWDEESWIALAYYLQARGRQADAERWLRKLHHNAQGCSPVSEVRIAAIMAINHSQSPNARETRRWLLAMLRLGESIGAVRSIIDFGRPMGQLLQALLVENSLATEPALLAYLQRLIGKVRSVPAAVRSEGAVGSGSPEHGLTGREAEILLLLHSGMQNKVIGRHLKISDKTVRWHIQNLFSKLHVNNRTQAVLKARQLRLIE